MKAIYQGAYSSDEALCARDVIDVMRTRPSKSALPSAHLGPSADAKTDPLATRPSYWLFSDSA